MHTSTRAPPLSGCSAGGLDGGRRDRGSAVTIMECVLIFARREPGVTQPPCRLSDEPKSVVGQGPARFCATPVVGKRKRSSIPRRKIVPLASPNASGQNRPPCPASPHTEMAGADSARAVFFALGANAAIAAAKYAAAAITGSGSMMAEAVHSTADCGNQLLLLLGFKRSRLPPDREHPLGFGKETYFWSFIVAIMLFSMGGLFSIYEGVHKLFALEPLSHPFIALGVLAFSIAMESASMAGALREVGKLRGDASLWSWFRSTRNSELAVVFAED